MCGAQARAAQAADAPLRIDLALDHPGPFEHPQVARDGRCRHLERLAEFADAGRASGQAGQDGTPRRVGKGGKSGTE